ncbi:MAG TPA: serine/threonine-protein kinase [Kofleriaceae bacterium]|nr:serine/threonine-protein kinase [Kofleriaceae bacterium]
MSEAFGSWHLESLIAVGGLGEVWRARRGVTSAALKRLHTHLVRNDEARALFAQEQQLSLALPRHPGVVHALDVGHVEGRPYVALEIAAGEDLRRMIAPPASPRNVTPATAVLPRVRAVAIVRAACAAAAHLHKFGWVHGDICPSNLIVDDNDHVVLIDLGVARRAGQGGTVRGTHAYMAPEQVRGEAWTPATDVFALGVILWELLADKRLFHRGPPWLSMAAVVEDPVPPLADRALDAIARAALAKDPAQRIATPTALADRLAL